MEATATQQEQQSVELIQVVETSGIAPEKQNAITQAMGRFFSFANEWDKKINTIEVKSHEDIESMSMAKEGRLTLKRMRIEGETLIKGKRDSVKARMANDVLEDKLWLKVGQMMEAVFKNLETRLEEKEKFAERFELQQKEERRQKRAQLIGQYLTGDPNAYNGIDLMNLSDDAFEMMLEGAKRKHELWVEHQKKEKEEREKAEARKTLHENRKHEIVPLWAFISPEVQSADLSQYSPEEWSEITSQATKASEKEKERLREIEEQNRILREEQDRKQAVRNKRTPELAPYIVFIRDYNTLIDLPEEEYKKELLDIKKGAELQWEEDRKEAEKKERERLEMQEQLRKETEARQKAEEAEKQRQKEIKQEEARRKREERQASAAPDNIKIAKFMAELNAVQPPDCQGEEGRSIVEFIKGQLTIMGYKVNEMVAEHLNAIDNEE